MNRRNVDFSGFSSEVDAERLATILAAILDGAKSKAITGLIKDGAESPGGWLTKARKTERAKKNLLWKRMVQLGRLKAESEMLRDKGLEQLAAMIGAWKVEHKFDQWKHKIVGVGGSFELGDKTISITGQRGKSFHMSSGGAGDGLCVFGACMGKAAWRAIDEIMEWAEGRIKPAKKTAAAVDREVIAAQYRHLSLPPDWQFDGKNYVNFYGQKSRLRPDIDEVVQLEKQRGEEEARRYNESVDELDDDGVGVLGVYKMIKW